MIDGTNHCHSTNGINTVLQYHSTNFLNALIDNFFMFFVYVSEVLTAILKMFSEIWVLLHLPHVADSRPVSAWCPSILSFCCCTFVALLHGFGTWMYFQTDSTGGSTHAASIYIAAWGMKANTGLLIEIQSEIYKISGWLNKKFGWYQD